MIRKIAFVLVMVLVLSTFSGCGLRQVEERLDALEEKVESSVDKAEHRTEKAAGPAVHESPAPKAADFAYEPSLSAEEAEEIALEHAGLSRQDVKFLHSEFDIDDGIRRYEVDFHQNMLEYEYSVHADSGEIISFEIDR